MEKFFIEQYLHQFNIFINELKNLFISNNNDKKNTFTNLKNLNAFDFIKNEISFTFLARYYIY